MNIGDMVYIHLLDIETNLKSIKELRTDRIGKIIDVLQIKNQNEFVLQFEILLINNKTLSYRTDNLMFNMISISELKEAINKYLEFDTKKDLFFQQLEAINLL